MKVGYARVSTGQQNLHLQEDALKSFGCEKIFSDVISGAKISREGLNQAIEFLRAGDTLVVWRLDRLGRSLKHLIEVINSLSDRNIGFVSLQENIDTSSSTGKLILHIFASLCEFERDLIRERTQAGLAAARARGRTGGRKKIMDTKKVSIAKALHKDPNTSIADICKTLKVSRATLYRYLKEDNVPAADDTAGP